MHDELMPFADRDRAWLERELTDIQKANRELRRLLEKTQQQLAETSRAYNKTVENMLAIIRENNELTMECERLRWNAHHPHVQFHAGFHNLPRINPEEASVIRKAMARLHHPDVGGDTQRMQYWNAVLDAIEQGHS